MAKVPAFIFRTDYLNHKASLKKSHRLLCHPLGNSHQNYPTFLGCVFNFRNPMVLFSLNNPTEHQVYCRLDMGRNLEWTPSGS